MRSTETHSSLTQFMDDWVKRAELPEGSGYFAYLVDLEDGTKDLFFLGQQVDMKAAVAEAGKVFPDYVGTVVGPLTLSSIDQPTSEESDNHVIKITFELRAPQAHSDAVSGDQNAS